MTFLIVLGAILMIFVWVYIAKQFEEIAEEKGFSGKRYFWIPFLFGIIGYIMVAALPDRGVQEVEVKNFEDLKEPKQSVFKNLSIGDSSSSDQKDAPVMSSKADKYATKEEKLNLPWE